MPRQLAFEWEIPAGAPENAPPLGCDSLAAAVNFDSSADDLDFEENFFDLPYWPALPEAVAAGECGKADFGPIESGPRDAVALTGPIADELLELVEVIDVVLPGGEVRKVGTDASNHAPENAARLGVDRILHRAASAKNGVHNGQSVTTRALCVTHGSD